MWLMNEVLNEFLGKFIIVFQDDILIFSKKFEEHMIHIHKVLDNFRGEKLSINFEKV